MTWITFDGQTTPQMSELDTQFGYLGAIAPIPCSVAGSNTLTLTPATNTPPVTAYANLQSFWGIAANVNSGAVTAQVGGLAPLSVFKDTSAGPVALTGNEIKNANLIILTYDTFINGFHLQTAPTILTGQSIDVATLQIASGATLRRMLYGTFTVTFSLTLANSTNDVSVPAAGVHLGDMVNLIPPATLAAGVTYMSFVPAAGTLTVRAANVTAGTLTPTGGTFGVVALGFTV